jgi:hypothetical protein
MNIPEKFGNKFPDFAGTFVAKDLQGSIISDLLDIWAVKSPLMDAEG